MTKTSLFTKWSNRLGNPKFIGTREIPHNDSTIRLYFAEGELENPTCSEHGVKVLMQVTVDFKGYEVPINPYSVYSYKRTEWFNFEDQYNLDSIVQKMLSCPDQELIQTVNSTMSIIESFANISGLYSMRKSSVNPLAVFSKIFDYKFKENKFDFTKPDTYFGNYSLLDEDRLRYSTFEAIDWDFPKYSNALDHLEFENIKNVSCVLLTEMLFIDQENETVSDDLGVDIKMVHSNEPINIIDGTELVYVYQFKDRASGSKTFISVMYTHSSWDSANEFIIESPTVQPTIALELLYDSGRAIYLDSKALQD